ncbi:hypothetical protein ACO2Q0_14950 [Phenylobacterium sp. VNQ135]|uniref:hypothetical protein n=1 Tax=Phenylobacterium sp. VNQ135 TaxID=3400922 RepID=UPI003C0F1D87
MPYRHAHWYVLAVLPLAALAFWPSYLGQIGTAPMQFHMHGLTATLWLLLLAAQSFAIHGGRRSLHRKLGLVSLALFPLFLAGGSGIFLGMAQRFAGEVSPFYTTYAPRLAWLDIVAVAGLAAFYFEALRQRRVVALHGGYLLATVVFLLGPIFGRLFGAVRFAIAGGPDYALLHGAFQGSNLFVAALAFAIAWRVRPNGRPFVISGALSLLMMLLFEFVGGTAWWRALFVRAADLPSAPVAVAVAILGALIAWAGWTAGRRAVRSPAAMPA